MESPAKDLLLIKSELQIGNVIVKTKKAARSSSEGGLLLLY